jgi:hypothetical protein
MTAVHEQSHGNALSIMMGSLNRTMQTFGSHIAWESEVWIAEDPDHMIHFNGERFLGPYPDVMPNYGTHSRPPSHPEPTH